MSLNIKELLQDNYEITERMLNNEAFFKLGELEITSGKLIIGDFGNNISIKNEVLETFPQGKFPIYYFRYTSAGAIIPFDTSKKIAAWKYAFYNSQTKKLKKYFDVESGNFCFTDSDGFAAIVKNESNNLYNNSFWKDEIMHRLLSTHRKASFDIPIANSQNNIITTSTEFGDGQYSSYIGYNENDDIVCLYTDLGPVLF